MTNSDSVESTLLEWYAALLIADGEPEGSMVDGVSAAVTADPRIDAKAAALGKILQHVQSLGAEKAQAGALFRMRLSSIRAAADAFRGDENTPAILDLHEIAKTVGAQLAAEMTARTPARQTATTAQLAPAKAGVVNVSSSPSAPDYVGIQSSMSASMSFRDYIRGCGITGITSEKIFFAPAIPAKKLAGAVAGLASQVRAEDIVVLVDDTVFGGSKEGVFFVDTGFYIKEPFEPARFHAFAQITSVVSEDMKIYVDGKKVVGLTLPEKLHLGYLFHVVQDFVKFSKVASGYVASAPVLPAGFDVRHVESVCTEALVAGTEGGRHIKFNLGGNLSGSVLAMTRFAFGILPGEAVILSIDLGVHDDKGAEAFLVTTAGLRSRCGERAPAVFVPWDELASSNVSSEFKDSVYCGVALSDGRRLYTSRQNTNFGPPGLKLVSDLAGYARQLLGGSGASVQRDEPQARGAFGDSRPKAPPASASFQSSAQGNGSSTSETLKDHLRRTGAHTPTDKISYAPNIPLKKLSGAMQSLAGIVSADDIVVLIDDTVFGGAKEGVFITNDRIFIKSLFVDLLTVPLENIKHIGIDGKTIYINHREAVALSQVEDWDLAALVSSLQDYLALGQKTSAARATTYAGSDDVAEDEEEEIETKEPVLDAAHGYFFFKAAELYPFAGAEEPEKQMFLVDAINTTTGLFRFIESRSIVLSEVAQWAATSDVLAFESALYVVELVWYVLESRYGLSESEIHKSLLADLISHAVFGYTQSVESAALLEHAGARGKLYRAAMRNEPAHLPRILHRCLLKPASYVAYSDDDTELLRAGVQALHEECLDEAMTEAYLRNLSHEVEMALHRYNRG